MTRKAESVEREKFIYSKRLYRTGRFVHIEFEYKTIDY